MISWCLNGVLTVIGDFMVLNGTRNTDSMGYDIPSDNQPHGSGKSPKSMGVYSVYSEENH